MVSVAGSVASNASFSIEGGIVFCGGRGTCFDFFASRPGGLPSSRAHACGESTLCRAFATFLGPELAGRWGYVSGPPEGRLEYDCVPSRGRSESDCIPSPFPSRGRLENELAPSLLENELIPSRLENEFAPSEGRRLENDLSPSSVDHGGFGSVLF